MTSIASTPIHSGCRICMQLRRVKPLSRVAIYNDWCEGLQAAETLIKAPRSHYEYHVREDLAKEYEWPEQLVQGVARKAADWILDEKKPATLNHEMIGRAMECIIRHQVIESNILKDRIAKFLFGDSKLDRAPRLDSILSCAAYGEICGHIGKITTVIAAQFCLVPACQVHDNWRASPWGHLR